MNRIRPVCPPAASATIQVTKALVFKADPLSADALRRLAHWALPTVVFEIASSTKAAADALAGGAFQLFVTGLEPSLDDDIFELLSRWVGDRATDPRIFVIAAREQSRVLMTLRALSIHGLFDSLNEPPGAFADALQRVAQGGRYWSPSIWERISGNLDLACSPFKSLTLTEQIVLSVIGDGCDDHTASATLGMSPSAISTVRRRLHQKLQVQQRGDLVRLAAQNGFVRFTASGVVRPGFALLATAYRNRRFKNATRTTLSAG